MPLLESVDGQMYLQGLSLADLESELAGATALGCTQLRRFSKGIIATICLSSIVIEMLAAVFACGVLLANKQEAVVRALAALGLVTFDLRGYPAAIYTFVFALLWMSVAILALGPMVYLGRAGKIVARNTGDLRVIRNASFLYHFANALAFALMICSQAAVAISGTEASVVQPTFVLALLALPELLLLCGHIISLVGVASLRRP